MPDFDVRDVPLVDFEHGPIAVEGGQFEEYVPAFDGRPELLAPECTAQ